MSLLGFKVFCNTALRPRGMYSFLRTLPPGTAVLDVGCGMSSPWVADTCFPHLAYTGLDIEPGARDRLPARHRYFFAAPEKFAETLEGLRAEFGAVVSSHNLEHCDERLRALRAVCDALKPGGVLYLSFPSEASTRFPSRHGALNYFDDPTHKDSPPPLQEVLAALKAHGLETEFVVAQHRPMLLRLLGLLKEPWSRLRGRVMRGTWELYGFESVIWARKRTA